MNNEELNATLESIQEKLGKENSALISDDLGMLITKNTQVLESLNNKDERIKKLESTNEKLVIANGNLLQQVPMSNDYEKHPSSSEEKKEEKKSFNFREAFDSKGHFKK